MNPRERIQKYLNKTLSAEERRQHREYLLQEDLTDLQETMQEEWESGEALKTPMKQGMFEAMLGDIRAAIVPEAVIKPLYQQRWLQVAVAAVVVLGLGFSLWLGVIHTPAQVEWQTYQTAFGEQAEIELPDGSQVVLNANASLRFAKAWQADETRKVWLEGEAYFDVADRHEEGIKFQVITEDLSVEVLGTQFNVNTYASKTHVYLEEGKIQLRTEQDATVVEMQPGELVTYSHQDKKIVSKETREADHHLSWRQGILVFKGVPFAEIAERIEEVYGLEVILEDGELEERIFTLGVPANNLELALAFMRKSMKVKITQSGDTLRIR